MRAQWARSPEILTKGAFKNYVDKIMSTHFYCISTRKKIIPYFQSVQVSFHQRK